MIRHRHGNDCLDGRNFLCLDPEIQKAQHSHEGPCGEAPGSVWRQKNQDGQKVFIMVSVGRSSGRSNQRSARPKMSKHQNNKACLIDIHIHKIGNQYDVHIISQ